MENGASSMKNSCISAPANEILAQTYKWQVTFCNGDFCAALILNYFEYWHNHCLVRRDKAIKANDIAEQNGEPRSANENLLQFHSYEEIREGILNAFSRTKVIEAIKFLEKENVLSIHNNPNPKLKFDKTKFYQFHPEICQRFIDSGHKYNKNRDIEKENTVVQIQTLDRLILDDRESESGRGASKSKRSIKETEITAEITKKAAAEKEGVACQQVEKENKNAAALFVSFDEKISDSLTNPQKSLLKEKVNALPKNLLSDPRLLISAFEQEMLNEKSFKQSEQIFIKKLNIILKQIKKGEWSPYHVLQKQKEDARQIERVNIETNINQVVELDDEINALNRLVRHSPKGVNTDVLQKQIKELITKKNNLIKQNEKIQLTREGA